MVAFIKARDVIKKRLDAVFTSDAFATLYGVQKPKVYMGFPTNEPPLYVAVDEIVDDVNTSGAASMGHAEVAFKIRVWCCVRNTSAMVASDTLLSYIDCIFNSVLAEHTLDMAVDNSMPSVEVAGMSTDNSKRHLASAIIAIDCRIFSQCPAELKEVINASSKEL